MPLQVNQNSSSSSSAMPDGSASFPFVTSAVQAPAIPAGATDIFGNSAVVSAATATATLAATASRLNYITGFMVTGLGATAATLAVITVTGLAGGTQTFAAYPVPAGVGVSGPIMVVSLPTPIPASAVNTAISVVVASFGSGNVGAQASVQGYMI